MDSLGGGARGYWKNQYYSRLDDASEIDGQDNNLLGGSAAKPPSGRRRQRKPPSQRRPKVVRVAPPPPTPPPQLQTLQPYFSTVPGAGQPGAFSSTFSVYSSSSTATTGISHLPTVPHHRRRRRFWRVRLAPRLAFLRRVASAPLRLLRGIQRGYVRMMLKFAGAMGGALGPGMGVYPVSRPTTKEYDEKVLVEIYRALVAQGHVLVVPEGGGVAAARLVAR